MASDFGALSICDLPRSDAPQPLWASARHRRLRAKRTATSDGMDASTMASTPSVTSSPGSKSQRPLSKVSLPPDSFDMLHHLLAHKDAHIANLEAKLRLQSSLIQNLEEELSQSFSHDQSSLLSAFGGKAEEYREPESQPPVVSARVTCQRISVDAESTALRRRIGKIFDQIALAQTFTEWRRLVQISPTGGPIHGTREELEELCCGFIGVIQDVSELGAAIQNVATAASDGACSRSPIGGEFWESIVDKEVVDAADLTYELPWLQQQCRDWKTALWILTASMGKGGDKAVRSSRRQKLSKGMDTRRPERVEMNLVKSDGTLIFSSAESPRMQKEAACPAQRLRATSLRSMVTQHMREGCCLFGFFRLVVPSKKRVCRI